MSTRIAEVRARSGCGRARSSLEGAAGGAGGRGSLRGPRKLGGIAGDPEESGRRRRSPIVHLGERPASGSRDFAQREVDRKVGSECRWDPVLGGLTGLSLARPGGGGSAEQSSPGITGSVVVRGPAGERGRAAGPEPRLGGDLAGAPRGLRISPMSFPLSHTFAEYFTRSKCRRWMRPTRAQLPSRVLAYHPIPSYPQSASS